MDDEMAWFAPRRHGFGAGPPIRWQGWLVMLLYAGAIGAAVACFRQRPLDLAAVIGVATLIMLVIVARTTRGGMR